MTKCRDCKDFRIRYQPLKVGKDCYDSGLAECKRYDLVVDFTSTHKLNRLTCVEEREGYCLNTDKSDTHKGFHFERVV